MSRIPLPSAIRQIMLNAPPDAINLGLGEPVFRLPREMLEIIGQKLPEWQLGYTPNTGLPELREQIAAAENTRTDAENICITCGAQEALYVVCHALLRTDDEALVPDPGFLAYPNLVRMAGANPVPYPMPIYPHEPFDIDAIRRRITKRTRLMVINSPANPTGYIMKRQTMASLAALCEQHGIIPVSDEVYRELWFEGERPCSIRDFCEQALTISSLSKTLGMTGWRLGWLIGPSSLISSLSRVHQYLTTCAPAVSQHVAICLFHNGINKLAAHHRRYLRICRDRLFTGIRSVNDWQPARPGGGLFIFTGIPDYFSKSTAPSANILKQTGVVTIPGEAFGNRGKSFVRLSFGVPEKDIATAIDRLNHMDTNMTPG